MYCYKICRGAFKYSIYRLDILSFGHIFDGIRQQNGLQISACLSDTVSSIFLIRLIVQQMMLFTFQKSIVEFEN